MKFPRRKFLKAASLAACCSVTSAAEPARSANNLLRVGVIGTGVRGKYLIGNLPESAQVIAICDCATSRMAGTLEPKGGFAKVLQAFREHAAAKCATYQDYRRMLDREQLDAVIIATPDHHHTLAAMLALQAGLHVYLEKPLTVSIREGRLLANMVKKTGRVLQVGSQQRTMEVNRVACEFIRNGGLGKITHVELPNYPGYLPVPALAEEPAFGGIEFDLFCGPAALRPHHRNLWVKDEFRLDGLLWRGWDLFRDYSGHLMTNWGAHSVDMAQLALGRDDTGPVEIGIQEPSAVHKLAQLWLDKTPPPVGNDSDRRFWPVTMQYADGINLRFNLAPDANSIVFHGEKGRLKMRRNEYETDPPELLKHKPDPSVTEKWKGGGNVAKPHLENWLAAIRNGTAVNAPVEAGHRTVTICHLANIARELKRPLRWNPTTEQFQNDMEANNLLERPCRTGFQLPTV